MKTKYLQTASFRNKNLNFNTCIFQNRYFLEIINKIIATDALKKDTKIQNINIYNADNIPAAIIFSIINHSVNKSFNF